MSCLCSGYLHRDEDEITARPGALALPCGLELFVLPSPLCYRREGGEGWSARAMLGVLWGVSVHCSSPSPVTSGERLVLHLSTQESSTSSSSCCLGKDSGRAGSLVLVPLMNGVTCDLRALRGTECPSSLSPVPVLSDTPRSCSSCVHLLI